jgi:hypothetical protein
MKPRLLSALLMLIQFTKLFAHLPIIPSYPVPYKQHLHRDSGVLFVRGDSSSSSTATTFWTLCEYISQFWIVTVFVSVMDTHVSYGIVLATYANLHDAGCLPLQEVWSRVFVFSIWAEWTHVSWSLMDKTVPYHLILPLESLSTFGSWTACNSAEVRLAIAMSIHVGAETCQLSGPIAEHR